MFKDLLTKTPRNSIDIDNNQTKTLINTQLKFREIHCPKTRYPITTSECVKCVHKKEYLRKHDLGLTLSTIICTWSETE